MAFREVPVFEVREVLRLWLRRETLRGIERLAGVDHKTVRRYVEAATGQGVVRDGAEGQLHDQMIGAMVEAVRPHRSDGHGEAWRLLIAHHDQIKAWLDKGLTVVKCHDVLSRQGVVVPERTLHRYALEVCGHRRGQGPTVRVADGRPGDECQIDFGRMGSLHDPVSDPVRAAYVLVFTACFSRHCFVSVSFAQTTEAVIDGCEAARVFVGGVFATVIPDNLSAVIDKASPTEPRPNQAFVEYARSRGFVVDPAPVRRPEDKPRVERVVPYVRASFFAGENFVDRDDAQRRAEEWCGTKAGMRIHGTTQCRPAELFALEEAPRLLPAPTSRYDVPLYAKPKVHRDHHIEVQGTQRREHHPPATKVTTTYAAWFFEALSAVVVDGRRSRVGMTSGDLHSRRKTSASRPHGINAARSMSGCTWPMPARLPIERTHRCSTANSITTGTHGASHRLAGVVSPPVEQHEFERSASDVDRTGPRRQVGGTDGATPSNGEPSAGDQVGAVPAAGVATRAAQDRVVLIDPRDGRPPASEWAPGTARTVGG